MTSKELILQVNPIIKGQINFNLSGNLYFGRMWNYWEHDVIKRIVSMSKINIIWNLTEESHGDILNAKELRSPIDDYCAPEDKNTFIKQASKILTLLEGGSVIFLHCYGCRGRTSVALATLLFLTGKTPQEALQETLKISKGPETKEQENFILELI